MKPLEGLPPVPEGDDRVAMPDDTEIVTIVDLLDTKELDDDDAEDDDDDV